jgi:hypothetical protein
VKSVGRLAVGFVFKMRLGLLRQAFESFIPNLNRIQNLRIGDIIKQGLLKLPINKEILKQKKLE